MRMPEHSQQGKKKTGDTAVEQAKSRYVLDQIISQNSKFLALRST